jgi:hypothetical protein
MRALFRPRPLRWTDPQRIVAALAPAAALVLLLPLFIPPKITHTIRYCGSCMGESCTIGRAEVIAEPVAEEAAAPEPDYGPIVVRAAEGGPQ